MSDYGRRRYQFSLHGQPWYWQRCQRRQVARFADAFKFAPGDTITLAPIIDAENLLANYHQLEREGGQAPGPDGIRFGDLGRRERADACRYISNLIAQGRYRPGPAQSKETPKPSGGTRTLKIRSILDRTISRAVACATTPVIDARLQDCSLGFRPGKNVLQLLAALEAAVIHEGRHFLVTDDIRQAFDHVSIDGALRAIARHIPDAASMYLIETMLRGHEGLCRQVGLDQGDPLSPLALNVFLDQVLDGPLLAAQSDTPFWRYADNLVWTCRNVSEGRRVLHEAHQLLDRTGLTLKANPGPINLHRQGAHVDLLGFRIWQRSVNQLTFGLANEAWWSLDQQLNRAQDTPEPAKTAEQVIRGWIESHGPAFGNDDRSAIVDRILHAAAQAGFREGTTENGLLGIAGEAYERWTSIRHRALSLGADVSGSVPLAVHDDNALRASERPRSPQGDAEAGLVGGSPATASSIP